MPAFASWATGLTSMLATLGAQKGQSNTFDMMITGMAQQEAVQNYTNQAVAGITALNNNCANALTTLVEFALLRPKLAAGLNITQHIRNTFVKAQQTTPAVRIKRTTTTSPNSGSVVETEEQEQQEETQALDKRLYANVLNDFYDDEGWWALAMIRSYDLTQNNAYLDAAVIIFDDMTKGHGGPCNGGIYWSKDREYKNTITNELYLSIAASLANRRPRLKRSQSVGSLTYFRSDS